MGLCHIISSSLNGPVSYIEAVLMMDLCHNYMGLCHILSCSLDGPMSYNKLFSSWACVLSQAVLLMDLCHIISCSLNGPVSYNKLSS